MPAEARTGLRGFWESPDKGREVCFTAHRQKDSEANRPVHTTAALPHALHA